MLATNVSLLEWAIIIFHQMSSLQISEHNQCHWASAVSVINYSNYLWYYLHTLFIYFKSYFLYLSNYLATNLDFSFLSFIYNDLISLQNQKKIWTWRNRYKTAVLAKCVIDYIVSQRKKYFFWQCIYLPC